MTTPPLEELLKAVEQIVRRASKASQLDKITFRIVRQEVEKEFGLEKDVLSTKEYKGPLKEATEKALKAISPDSESEEEPRPKAKAKGKVPSKENSYKKKPKSAPDHPGEDEGEEVPKNVVKSKPKSKTGKEQILSKPKSTPDDVGKVKNAPEETISAAKKKAATAKKKDGLQYKTPEHVPTSDMEQDEPYEPEPNIGSSKTKPSSPATATNLTKSNIESFPSPKRRKREPIIMSDAESNVEEKTEEIPRKKAKLSLTTVKEVIKKDESETELSDLVDKPPKRKKSKSTEKEGKKKDRSPAKKSATSSKPSELSKDEETIKRLKSLVVACGVRKVWSRVFEGIASPRSQIKKLKEILSDLGMTGRLSMEQAKTIKQNRELAKELEDVQEFEKSLQRQSSLNQRRAAGKEEQESDEGRSESEEDSQPRKRPGNARTSIMSFLQDQSDEGD